MNRLGLNFYQCAHLFGKHAQTLNYSLTSLKKTKNYDIFTDPGKNKNTIAKRKNIYEITSSQKEIVSKERVQDNVNNNPNNSDNANTIDWFSKLTVKNDTNIKSTYIKGATATNKKFSELDTEEKTIVILDAIKKSNENSNLIISQEMIDLRWNDLICAPSYSKLCDTIKYVYLLNNS